MTGIIDYGCGNLFSLKSSLKQLGECAEICTQPSDLKKYRRLILPGVGAFGIAVEKLKGSGLFTAVLSAAEAGVPILGICLGMQLLFEKSYEYGEHIGLSLLHGEIRPLNCDTSLKIPHMGWNNLQFKQRKTLFKYVEDGEYVYFVHSFHAKKCDSVIAETFYGTNVCAAAGMDNVFATQFHPEKSGDTGLRILKGFLEL